MQSTKCTSVLGGGVTAGQVGTVLDQQHCLAAISTHEDDSRDSTSGRL